MATNNTNLAGEFYAMHRLYRSGLEPALTLGNTKGVDILLYNPINEKQFKIEVKTSTQKKNESLFGRSYAWMMNKKHEDITGQNLIYCFVYIPGKRDDHPQTFFVPSHEVAEYVKWEHIHYLKHRPDSRGTDIRTFRILADEVEKWQKNVSLFD